MKNHTHDHHNGHHVPEDHLAHSSAQRRTGLNAMALSATLHCLTGCAIGEILGLILGTYYGLGSVGTIMLAVALAFLFGYILSAFPLLRAGLSFKKAITIVLAADTLSIFVMEVVDNAVMAAVPGAMDAGLNNPLFWLAMMAALTLAFFAAYPVNSYLLRREKGHALTHEYHHGSASAGVSGWRRYIPDIGTSVLAAGIFAFMFGGLVVSLAG